MRIGYFSKRMDACYYLRVFVPRGHLNLRGHETAECLVEQLAVCKTCGHKEFQEIQMDTQGDEYHCKHCRMVLMGGLNAWKQAVYEVLDNCDVAVFQRVAEQAHLNLMREAKSRGKFVIFEADDNYIDVPKKNPGFAYHEKQRLIIEEILRTADGITVTTQALKRAYSVYNENIQVIPNAYDLELYDCSPVFPSHQVFNGKAAPINWNTFLEARSKSKFVCWAGSPTHEEDLELVIKPLKKLLERENVIVGMAAYVHARMIQLFPQDRLFLFSLVSAMNWYSMMKTLSPDVWIAPLVSNEFNLGKSNIKKIESAMMGSIFVGSDIETYNSDRFQGRLVNTEYDWFRALRWGVNMPDEERKSIIDFNRSVLAEEYDIKKTVDLWERFFSTRKAQ